MLRWGRWPCRRSFQDERAPAGEPGTTTPSAGSGGGPTTKIHIKLKQWRGLATRYDKTVTIYLAAICTWSTR